ncbi:MAG: helix-turn-helix domain-containing protein [Bacillota bacterium]
MERLAESYHRLHTLTTTTAEERLADALVRLAGAHLAEPRSAERGEGEGPGGPVTLDIARQQPADILGVAKETAVRALGSLVARKGRHVAGM